MGEINKIMPVSLTGDVTLTGPATLSKEVNIKWIDGETEPDAPDGYARAASLDLDIPIKVMDTTVTVKLWAFKQQT